MRCVAAPELFKLEPGERTVFLGGTIDYEPDGNWQEALIATIDDLPVVILNPRQTTRPADWSADAEYPPFSEQIDWELTACAQADVVVLYFAPNAKSPIGLFQLGLATRNRRVIICCPAGNPQKEYIDLVCARYRLRNCSTFTTLVHHFRGHIEHWLCTL